MFLSAKSNGSLYLIKTCSKRIFPLEGQLFKCSHVLDCEVGDTLLSCFSNGKSIWGGYKKYPVSGWIL